MCGLTGFHRRSGRYDEEAVTIRLMTAAQLHRGPDDFGHIGIESRTRWIGELPRKERQTFSRPVDLLFGFRRLSILDLSEKGHQANVEFGRSGCADAEWRNLQRFRIRS